jgi:hypothetical protein
VVGTRITGVADRFGQYRPAEYRSHGNCDLLISNEFCRELNRPTRKVMSALADAFVILPIQAVAPKQNG